MNPLFALVDCNNFYVSCERLFRPDLANRGVVVLSNNDGCAVARSSEVKALGVKMGAPYFQIKQLIRQHNIEVFSSNYTLYADISSRVMNTLEGLAPGLEVYSIDEAFLDLTGMANTYDLEAFGQSVRHRIDQNVGIPVCVGIAPTKTLAKLANHAAKTYPATEGVVDLTDPHRQRRLMALIAVQEVWGVGSRISKRLQALGIRTALDLADADPALIRKEFSVVMERTLRELNGISCLGLEDVPPTKQQIVCSRSFGAKITQQHDMRDAVAGFVVRACEKLRAEGQLSKTMSVFIRTSPFGNDKPFAKTVTGKLIIPSADTRDFLALARSLLESIWKDGPVYAKAGVMLFDFSDPSHHQHGLFDEEPHAGRNQALMEVVDNINRSSKSSIRFASQCGKGDWRMKREFLSPAYTTDWKSLPAVK